MSAEFRTIGPNSVASNKGFTVTWRPSGGVDYTDASGTLRIDSEVLVKPTRIVVYPKSGGLRTMDDARAEEILKDVIRAVEYLGYKVER